MDASLLPLAPALAMTALGLIFFAVEALTTTLGVAALVGLVAFGLGIASLWQAKTVPNLAYGWDFVASVGLFGTAMVGIVLFLARRISRSEPSNTEDKN